MTRGAAFGPPFCFVGLCNSPLSLLAMHAARLAARPRPSPGAHDRRRGKARGMRSGMEILHCEVRSLLMPLRCLSASDIKAAAFSLA